MSYSRLEANDPVNKQPELTRQTEWLVLLFISAIVFLARFHFREISFWEWDETLFASGIHKYDLWDHSSHPLPPGTLMWWVIPFSDRTGFGPWSNGGRFTLIEGKSGSAFAHTSSLDTLPSGSRPFTHHGHDGVPFHRPDRPAVSVGRSPNAQRVP